MTSDDAPGAVVDAFRPLNDRGQVLLLSQDFSAGATSYVWRAGRAVSLGALTPPVTAPGPTKGLIADWIADSGVVAGYGYVASPAGGIGVRAFRWWHGRLTGLPGLGGSSDEAVAAADDGTEIGSSETASGVQHAVVWSGDRVRDLGLLPGGSFSTATAMGGPGGHAVIAVRADDAAGREHPAVWLRGRLVDLGLPAGATAGYPSLVDARGDVYGTITRGTADHPIIDVYRWRLT